MTFKKWTTGMLACFVGAVLAQAQTPETPISQQGTFGKKEAEHRIVEALLQLKKDGTILSKKQIDKQMADPQPQVVELPPLREKALSTEEVAVQARKANLRVGYAYLCPRCDDWHLALAGGYAIAEDVVVTCDHVVRTTTAMREGHLIAVDHEGNVAAATAILARSDKMDVGILKMTGAKFKPVPLNRNVTQGTASYCYSHPLKEHGYFSAGIINRFVRESSYNGEKEDTLDALRHLRVNFSNDWAPGSSGSPLFDQAGNVVGHVSTIAGLSSGKGKPPLITLHSGIPAGSVEALVRAMADPAEIKRVLELDTKKR